MRRALRDSHPLVLRYLNNIRDAVEPLSEPRHFYVHRGESRTLGRFSEVQYLDLVAENVGIPMDSDEALRNRTEARWEVLRRLRDEKKKAEESVQDLLVELLSPYLGCLADLGGLEDQIADEIVRFVEVVDWFQGGKEPDWHRR